MVLVPAPEGTMWVAFAEPWVRLKHSLGCVEVEDGLSGLNGVPLEYVDLRVDVVFTIAKFAVFKPKVFQVVERLGAGIDMALFSEVSLSVVGGKHHGHPVVAGIIIRKLFRVTARYFGLHKYFTPVTLQRGQADACPLAIKNNVTSV